jgi:hypothetical protein
MAMIPEPPVGFDVLPAIGHPETGFATRPYTHPSDAGVSPVGMVENGEAAPSGEKIM